MRLKSPAIPLITLLLLLGQIFFPHKNLMILLAGLGGAWLVSYLWARSLQGGLRLERELRHGWMQVGDPLQERVTVVNDGWAPGLWVQVVDESQMEEHSISTVADVRSFKNRFWYARSQCQRRGLYRLGPTRLQAGDPLGIYQVSVEYQDSVYMVVMPQVVGLPELEVTPAGQVGEGRSPVRTVGETVTSGGVREYVPGDRLHRIHWPTTARMGEPFVRLFEDQRSSDWWVLLDMDSAVQVGAGAKSTEEYGVVLAASLVNEGLQSGKLVGVISHGEELIWQPPGSGEPHMWKILQALATARPGGPPLAEMLHEVRRSLHQPVSLVVITPNLNPDWVEALVHLQRAGFAPTVILLDPVSFGGFGDLQGLRERLIRLGIRHYTITADFLDSGDGRGEKGWGWWLFQEELRSKEISPRKALINRLLRLGRNAALLVTVFLSAATALAKGLPGIESSLLTQAGMMGLIVGGLLSLTALPALAYALLALASGLTLHLINLGQLTDDLYTILVRGSQGLGGWLTASLAGGKVADWKPLERSLAAFWTQLASLIGRLVDWPGGVLRGQVVFDPVAEAFYWSLGLLLCALWGVWFILRRAQPIPALAPTVAFLAVSLTALQVTAFELLYILGAWLMLIALQRHDLRERAWRAARLYFDATIRPRLSATALALAVLLMTVALVTPSISWQDIKDLWQRLTADSGPRIVLPSREGPAAGGAVQLSALDERRNVKLPNQHLIGVGGPLSDEPVMKLTIESGEVGGRYYVRGLVYDKYTGHGWEAEDVVKIPLPAGEAITPDAPANSRLIRQRVEMLGGPRGLLFTVGTPLAVDQPVKAAWRVRDPERQAYDLFGASLQVDAYGAESFVPLVHEEALLQAGQAYPKWVRERYLQLPADVSQRIRTLARDLTATAATPYERAIALENYLRRIPYSLEVDPPPVDAEISEYFLFTLGRGYCDYYATAMVVMARAAGLPARLVTGYLAMDYDPEAGYYLINADQAHAWVEIYFPEIGWIPFEPTGGRAPIERAAAPEYLGEEPLELPGLRRGVQLPAGLRGVLRYAPQAAASLALLGLVWLVAREARLARQPAAGAAGRLFRRLSRMGRRLGAPARPLETPRAYASRLERNLRALALNSHWAGWLESGLKAIAMVSAAHVRAAYGPPVHSERRATELVVAFWKFALRAPLFWLLHVLYGRPIIWPLFWRIPPEYALLERKTIEDERDATVH
jgi:uncharacterized protein (DUF58 family)/transglutaminase-like putative cysteine protease